MIIPSVAKLQNFLRSQLPGIFGTWSVYDTNTMRPICSFDTFYGFSYTKKNTVTEYPIEQGSFATYNKQTAPFNAGVILIKSGLNFNSDRKRFLDTLEDYCDSTKLVDIATPSKTYIGCTLGGLDYKHMPDDGADLLVVSLDIKQIKELVPISSANLITSPKNLNAASTVSVGTKQAVPFDISAIGG
jgi:hypothetical protein